MERTQWERTVDVSTTRVPGTKLRWRHSCWRRRVVGKEITLVAAEVHRVHDPLAQTHHLLKLCPYPIQRHMVHGRAHVLG
jgi:hypothetical protein